MLLKHNEFRTQGISLIPITSYSKFHCASISMCSHRLRVLGLTKDLQEVIIGEEVEPREALSLSLEIHVQ